MGKRGPAKGSGGRPKKPLVDKILEGNPGKRKLTVLEMPQFEKPVELPQPPGFLAEAAKGNDKWPSATEIYTETVEWLNKTGCISLINPAHIEEYALNKARWLECEAMNAKHGLLAKHPTTGQPMQSPYVQMAITYLKQADSAWAKIYEVVKGNCQSEFRRDMPHEDVMERLLTMRRGG